MNTKKKISLEDAGNQNPFAVPEGFFENFAIEMDKRVAEKKVRVFRMKKWMYAAAMLAGVLIAGQITYSVYQNNLKTKADNYESYVLSQVDEASMMDYYVTNQQNTK